MAAPVVGTNNTNTVVAATPLTITLTNAPSAGGMVVVLCALYTDTNNGSWSCTSSGGSGVTVTERFNNTPANNAEGLFGWTVVYTTAPTSLSIQCSQGSPFYGSASAINISGQTAVDVASTSVTTGTSTTPTATGLPDLTDASDLVLGVMTYTSSSLTISAGTNWTQVTEIDEANSSSQASNTIQRTPGATGAFDPTWTLSSSAGWLAGGIAIAGTEEGGSATTDDPLLWMREMLDRVRAIGSGWRRNRDGRLLVPAYPIA